VGGFRDWRSRRRSNQPGGVAVMAVQTVPDDPIADARRAQVRAEMIARLQALARSEPLLIDAEPAKLG
jgi:hypothetical protein